MSNHSVLKMANIKQYYQTFPICELIALLVYLKHLVLLNNGPILFARLFFEVA